jgi:cytochrome b561
VTQNADRYSAPGKILHSATAVIVLGIIPVGVIMGRLEPSAAQDRLFALHESLGVSALALAILRMIVRLRGAPAPYPRLGSGERIVSTSVHRAIYLLLLLTPILGWLALSAYGLGPSFFGLGPLPALLAKDEPLSKTLFALHAGAAILLAAVAVLHIAGAFRHAVIARDDLVARMLPRGRHDG